MWLSAFWKKLRAGGRGSPEPSGGGSTGAGGDAKTEAAEKARQARMLEGFDWRFYLSFYPDLKQQGITTKRAARKHWLTYGWVEGRISGPRCEAYLKNLRQLEQYLTSVGDFVPAADSPAPLINILTRTNQRPQFFSENRSSIAGQTCKKYRHLVSYENEEIPARRP